MTPIDRLVQYIRGRHETNQSFENLVENLKQEEKKQMIGFYRWMLKTDTADHAEEFFHFSDEDMLEQYLNGDYGPGWRDLSEPLEGEPQDTDPVYRAFIEDDIIKEEDK
jgi:hypothetical protein